MSDLTTIRRVAIATSVVVASTGLSVTAQAVAAERDPRTAAAVTPVGPLPAEASVQFPAVPVGKRLAAVEAKKHRLAARALRAGRAQERASRAATRTVSSDGARGIASSLAASRYGWGADQFSCLDSLWERESGWNVYASNSSGAYGIPQALPGSKMGANGGNWRNDATTQITWGLSYIDGRYGDPCNAWDSFRAKGWY